MSISEVQVPVSELDQPVIPAPRPMSRLIESPEIERPRQTPMFDDASDETEVHRIHDALENVFQIIAPMWSLRDFVAVNPFLGLSDRPFLNARRLLRAVSDAETLAPLSWYRELLADGRLTVESIDQVLSEMRDRDPIAGVSREDVLEALQGIPDFRATGCQ